ncbi:uncharacterized protein SPSK_03614 [Sporothrix schenckii 1099-18]|uniref:Oxo-4-hydroxy-4-carboxy-5-ureidoimidazoline decarboxylase domain-containing protein n=1 Tax=Sporothrix schenckii 1099-18 TaxID=1397361 RepID=A0A0F2LYF1_SPOSC|nr:uncharacterized protein SPSK_03614 [Sporothrix schenckii 1099-18]KJR81889.1 hypothetical protein SPSK_03614 [Sporothrix schenckii 1099-18]
MASLSLPPIATLASLPVEDIAAALDLLFEHSKDLHALAVPAIRSTASSGGLNSYDDVADTVRTQLLELQNQVATFVDPNPTQAALAAKSKLLNILCAHPRLGAKKVESTQSVAEQAQLNKASANEARLLAALNAEYEAAFPGLVYVVFVNSRSRDEIMENMRARIDRGVYALEEVEAIEAMTCIAKDRASKLTH